MRNGYKIFVRNFEGMISVVRRRPNWVENIKMGIKELGCEGLDWIHLWNMVMNLLRLMGKVGSKTALVRGIL